MVYGRYIYNSGGYRPNYNRQHILWSTPNEQFAMEMTCFLTGAKRREWGHDP